MTCNRHLAKRLLRFLRLSGCIRAGFETRGPPCRFTRLAISQQQWDGIHSATEIVKSLCNRRIIRYINTNFLQNLDLHFRSRDSSADIVTGLQPGRLGVLILVEAKVFIQTFSGARKTSYLMGVGVLCSGVKRPQHEAV